MLLTQLADSAMTYRNLMADLREKLANTMCILANGKEESNQNLIDKNVKEIM